MYWQIQVAHLKNESFRTDFFETDYLKFPSRFFLTKVKYKDANANQGLNPSYSSHPDVQKKKKCNSVIA